MDKKNLYMGMGMGIAACGLGAALFRPRRNKKVKSTVGKALLYTVFQGALLYLATVLGLKKGLNLA